MLQDLLQLKKSKGGDFDDLDSPIYTIHKYFLGDTFFVGNLCTFAAQI